MNRFEFLAGSRPLDFVNTVSWGDGGEERLHDIGDLLAWCRAAGVPRGRGADPRVFAKAMQLRAALHALFLARAEERKWHTKELDGFLASALRQLTVRGSEWVLRDPNDARAPLWWLTWEAALLLTSDTAASIRRCSNDNCLWLFVDQSRRHNRRWCDMQVCGSRAKSRAYYERSRAQGLEEED